MLLTGVGQNWRTSMLRFRQSVLVIPSDCLLALTGAECVAVLRYWRWAHSMCNRVYVTVGCPSVRLSVCPIYQQQQGRPAGLLLSAVVCSRYRSIAAARAQRYVKSRWLRLNTDLFTAVVVYICRIKTSLCSATYVRWQRGITRIRTPLMQQSIDIFYLPGPQQQTRHTLLPRSNEPQTDRRKDTVPSHRPSACYAGSANSVLLIVVSTSDLRSTSELTFGLYDYLSELPVPSMAQLVAPFIPRQACYCSFWHITVLWLAAWRSDFSAWTKLPYPIVMGDRLRAYITSRHVTSQLGKLCLHPPGSLNWVPA